MKKLLAIVLAVAMITASLLTWVSATDEITAGAKFDLTGSAFAFGLIDGGTADASKFVAFSQKESREGPTTDKLTAGMGTLYHNGVIPENFGWGRPDSAKILFVGDAGAAQCYVGNYNYKVIKFIAPVDGTYTMNASTLSFSGGYVATSVAGAAFTNNAAHTGAPATGPDQIKYNETFNLKAGDAYYFAMARMSSSDENDIITMYLEKLEITLDTLGYEAPKEPVAVYDFVESFEDLTDSCFSLAMGHRVHGILTTTTKWCDGSDESHKNDAYGGVLTGYWTGNADGYHVDCFKPDKSKVVWYTQHQDMQNIIVFTAPADGIYEYDLACFSLWGCTASSVAYHVMVNGEVHNGNTVNYAKDTTAAQSQTNFTGTVELEAGQTIHFVHDSDGSAASDNGAITKLQVKRYEKESGAPETNVTYDIVDYFGKAECAPFSFGEINTQTKDITILDATVGTGKINQYDAKEWTAYKTADTRGLTRTDSDAVTDARFLKGMIWEEVAAGESGVTVFTAPADGDYTFKMTAHRWWAINTNVAGGNGSAITVIAGGETNTADLIDQTGKTVEGTVTLKAGDTIVFYVDSLGNGASDNYTLDELKVTATVKAPVEEECDHADAEWTTTATTHAKTCECGETVVAEAAHVWGDDNVCDACGYKCSVKYTIDKATWGTTDVMGNFKFYFGDDWNNVSGSLSNPKTLTLNANGVQLDTTSGKKVFYKVGDSACIWLEDQSYLANIIFTAPADGTYKYHFDYHKWGTSDSIWVDGGVMVNGKWDSDFVTANDTRKVREGEITLKAGDKIYFFLRCAAGLGVTVNDLYVEYSGHACTAGNCVEAGVCETCGAVCGEIDKNNHKSEEIVWEKTETKHSATYKCCGGVYVAEADHVLGTNNTCEVCGYVVPETPCTEHKGGTATCTEKAVCSECGASYGELKAHDYSEATCTEKATCKDCGATTGSLKDHTYRDGFCVDCGDEDPDYVPVNPNPPTSDRTASIALLIAGIAVLGLAFVPSKKKAD